MLRWTVLVILIVLCSSSTARADDAPERALKLHDEAKTLYKKGKYNDAIEKLKLAVELDPDAKILYYNLGLIEEKLGHIDTAIAYFRRCLELENKHDEKVHLARTIKRLEGARQYVDWSNNQQAAPVIIRRSSGGDSRHPGGGASHLLPWVYVAGGATVVAAAIGVGLAVRAGDVDPGDTPATAPGRTMDDLQAQADEAHGLAIGADVSFGIAAGALATTVALALVTAHGWGGSSDTASQHEAHTHEVSIGPLGGRWVYRF
jgi:tetratricopeptide (TPR) repeat protein